MQLDHSLLCSAAQAITTTAVSTNAIDLGAAGRDIGAGTQLFAVAHVVDEAFAASGAGTLTIDFVEADDAALSSNVEVISSTGAVGKATLVPGYKAVLPIPPRSRIGAQRFIGFRYTVSTGPMTAGKITAYVHHGVETLNAYPSGI